MVVKVAKINGNGNELQLLTKRRRNQGVYSYKKIKRKLELRGCQTFFFNQNAYQLRDPRLVH